MLEAIKDDNGLAESIQVDHIFFDIVRTNIVSVKMENVLYFCLQSCPNNQVLSCNLDAFPTIGNPQGPGGTRRHGLLRY